MPEAVDAEAPGRVNLIGEHTDYHDGYVLPAVIPQRTRVRLVTRGDRLVQVRSTAYPGSVETFELGAETPGRGWLDYVQGTTYVMARPDRRGFDVTIESDVPPGAGLSSSAALTVAILRGLRRLEALDLGDVELARRARAVETDFVGAPVGIMDPMACSLGRAGHALFLDTRTLAFEHLPLPPETAFIVINSGLTHRHADGGYRDRRRESLAAATALGATVLRDVPETPADAYDALPAPLGRRARHVVSENRRVLAAVDAIRRNDPVALGRLLNESHRSLRDDYEVSAPDVDTLVAIAARHPAVFGARITGGGFGGAVVVAAPALNASSTAQQICDEYVAVTGRGGETLAVITAGSGTGSA